MLQKQFRNRAVLDRLTAEIPKTLEVSSDPGVRVSHTLSNVALFLPW